MESIGGPHLAQTTPPVRLSFARNPSIVLTPRPPMLVRFTEPTITQGAAKYPCYRAGGQRAGLIWTSPA